MEDFIERTLRERRTVQQALADILAKHDRLPCGNERSMLERMVEVLTNEIALRKSPRGDRNDVAA
jgi:CRISPR/Cas system Type II protein with McrA/HNH and RuvC-like nuclease domain